MKILQIGIYPPPYGGWSLNVKLTKEFIEQKGHLCSVMNIGPNRKIKSDKYIDVQSLVDYAIKIFRCNKNAFQIYKHFDGHSLKGLILALVAQIVTLLFRKRVVLNFRAGSVQKCFSNRYFLHKALSIIIFRLAKVVICNSEEVKKSIIGNGIAATKIYPIPAFTKQYLRFKRCLTDEEKIFIENHSPVIIIYLYTSKDYDILSLFTALKSVKKKFAKLGIVIVDPTNEVKQYINEYDLCKISLCLGEKTHDNFLSILEQSDLYVRTHIRDGVCSSVLESLHLGVPVVACDNNSRPEGVLEYRFNDTDDLEKKIIDAIERMTEVKTHINDIYSGDKVKDNVEENYRLLEELWDK